MPLSAEPDALPRPQPAPWGRSLWATVAAFGVYFCMYAFRKPFTAGAYEGVVWGLSEKTVLVVAQVLGYMTAKFIGIRVIAEMPPQRRALGIIGLIAAAEGFLLLFAVVPSPWHALCFFGNGFPLGLFFGLVVGYLEGRRHTEALAAGLCASFILADGVTKSLGTWLLESGLDERWMPAAAGVAFAPPFLFFVWMLSRIPPPTPDDVDHRCQRQPMLVADRRRFLVEYGPGVASLVFVFLLITILRSMRADFGRELWLGLGETTAPALFTKSELCVTLGVLLVNGLSVLIEDNRRAFFTAVAVSIAAMLLLGFALLGLRERWFGGFAFMVLTGLGLYLPYVAMHTTLFERMIAMTRERGNIGFLIYLADSIGYLGYVAILVGKERLSGSEDFLSVYLTALGIGAACCAAALAVTWTYFSSQVPAPEPTRETA